MIAFSGVQFVAHARQNWLFAELAASACSRALSSSEMSWIEAHHPHVLAVDDHGNRPSTRRRRASFILAAALTNPCTIRFSEACTQNDTASCRGFRESLPGGRDLAHHFVLR